MYNLLSDIPLSTTTNASDKNVCIKLIDRDNIVHKWVGRNREKINRSLGVAGYSSP